MSGQEFDAVLAERDALAQAIHDGRGILGFDNDGDDRPHTSDYIEYAEHWRQDATQERADRDEAAREFVAVEKERDELLAENERLREALDQADPEGWNLYEARLHRDTLKADLERLTLEARAAMAAEGERIAQAIEELPTHYDYTRGSQVASIPKAGVQVRSEAARIARIAKEGDQ